MLRGRNLSAKMARRLELVGACVLAGGAWLALQDPIPVVRVTTPLPEGAPFWYMILAFPILGLLLSDLLDLYTSEGVTRSTIELGFHIGLIIVLSSARLTFHLPLSGHSLLVSYFIFRRLLLGPVSRGQSAIEVWLAVGVLAAIAYPKLAWWSDPVTLFAGIALGALLAVFSRWIAGTPLARTARG